jgi:crotonobetainyl-CoA:carnitine CoA-transferase CaiB-like acyl-CoA transferase
LAHFEEATSIDDDPDDLPHLERGFWQPVDRPLLGLHHQPSAPFCEAGQGPCPVRRPAPMLGQDKKAVLGGLLGLSDAELRGLSEAGIIGCEAVPVFQRRARTKQT